MKILFVAAEAAPVIKVGGLADVVGALPKALLQLGHDTRILLPKYDTVPAQLLAHAPVVATFDVPWDGGVVPINVYESRLPNSKVPLYLLDAPALFSGGGTYYEHGGEGAAWKTMQRFVFFSWASSFIIERSAWQPDVVHCHDWHAAATIPFLALRSARHYPSVLTIHNIEIQGKWSPKPVWQLVGLRGDEHSSFALRDSEGNLNLLQQGIHAADKVNTVSPTYAHELLTVEYGMGLQEDLRKISGGIQGIVNGIDTVAFDPATDTRLPSRYDITTVTVGKHAARRALTAELGLAVSDGPLFGTVGRLTSQKGIDLISHVLPDIIQAGGQLVVLGTGVPDIEQALVAAAQAFPTQCVVLVKFDAALAQRIYAASDFFLMPSRFEPCGLGQLVAMRYGALPIVRDTGGLHDTVKDLRRYRDGSGLVFGPATVTALRTAVQDALRIARQHDTLQAARRTAMSQDFSWSRSALDYVQLYQHAAPTART